MDAVAILYIEEFAFAAIAVNDDGTISQNAVNIKSKQFYLCKVRHSFYI